MNEALLIDLFILLCSLFCFWRGWIAVRTKKFRWIWDRVYWAKGRGAVVLGYFTILAGVLLLVILLFYNPQG